MPELPEVETTCQGISLHIKNKKITNVIINTWKLRWPITKNLKNKLNNQTIQKITRRGKYIVLSLNKGSLIIHLGMSGKLTIISKENYSPPNKHDHFELSFSNNKILRYCDPRKFGTIQYTSKEFLKHKLLKNLGVEPLSTKFNGKFLHNNAQNKKCNIKQFIMNAKIVVGIGNIYANEILFLAKINPLIPAFKISLTQFNNISKATKIILKKAIKMGGTTLKDFYSVDNKPGYFSQTLSVYGRKDQNCIKCKTLLKEVKINNRSTIYCPNCQKG